jgi:hypothetical protein
MVYKGGMHPMLSKLPALGVILAVVLPSLSEPLSAEGLAARAYFGLPLGAGKPFFGLRGDIESPFGPLDQSAPILARPADVDLRFSARDGAGLSINGVALDPVFRRYASEDDSADRPAKSGNEFDWYNVAGIAVGVGLIAAVIAADDVRIQACSGTNCPPEKEPKPEPGETENAN